jgi:hypothetical protein
VCQLASLLFEAHEQRVVMLRLAQAETSAAGTIACRDAEALVAREDL